jgi:hypothetical protein
LASPALTGVPTAPTYTAGSLQQIANVSYVQGYIQSTEPVVVTFPFSVPYTNVTSGSALGAQNSYTSSVSETSQSITFTSAINQFILNFTKPIYLNPSTLLVYSGVLTNTQTNTVYPLQSVSYTSTSITLQLYFSQTVTANVPYELSVYAVFNKT